jgi:cytochrome c-type biogenesis protein CcmE
VTRKRRRLWLVATGLALLGAASVLVLTAFEDNLVFFYSPSDVAAKSIGSGQRIRLGGLVEEGSVSRQGGAAEVTFRVTDLASSVPVTYTGILPDLFREGQGVVAQGAFRPDGTFVASEVLAKHDENYMPPEVADALKKSGQWKEGATK